jgi:hypothetical protein
MVIIWVVTITPQKLQGRDRSKVVKMGRDFEALDLYETVRQIR